MAEWIANLSCRWDSLGCVKTDGKIHGMGCNIMVRSKYEPIHGMCVGFGTTRGQLPSPFIWYP
jgi:hypothetical protein